MSKPVIPHQRQVGAIAPVKEPAWHRNDRRKRRVARGLVSAADIGLAVPAAVVDSARGLLLGHHGSANMVRSTIAQNAWKCPVCSMYDTLEVAVFWVGQHKTCCPKCNLAKPTKALLFKNSKTYQAS